MNRIVKNSFFNVLYSLLNVAFPLVTSMYVSRVLLPVGVGMVSYAQTTVSYFVVFASSGMSIYALREFSKAREDRERRNKVFTELLIINTITTLIACVIYSAMVLSVEAFRKELFLYFSTGLLLVFQFINIDWMYQGLEHYGYITARSFVVKLASLVMVILFVKTKENYAVYALISSVAIGGNNIFNVVNARKYIKLTKNVSLKQHISPIFFVVAVTYLSEIYSKVDITMLGMITTKEIVGYYSYAHKIIDIITMLCVAVSTVLMPRLSLLYEKDREKFNKIVNTGIRVIVFITLPVFSGVLILAPQAIEVVFGSSFAPAAVTVRYFSPMILIKPLANLLCYQLMICTGNEKKRLPAFIAAVVINIGLNSFMIPMWQHNGAAVASVISELVVNTVQIFIIVKIVPLNFINSTIFKSLIATVAMTPVVILVQMILGNVYLQLFLAAAAGAAVYVLVGMLLKNELIYMLYIGIKQKLVKK